MVGFLHSPLTEKAATKEKENHQNIQPLFDSKQLSSPNYSLELRLPELNDFTSFPDYVDFDSLHGWLTEGDHNMTDLGGNPVEFGEDKGELVFPKEVLGSVEEGFCGKVKSLVVVETEANGVYEKGLGVERTSDKSGKLGVLIEEQLEKVSLDGAKYTVDCSEIRESGINVHNERDVSCGETRELHVENTENCGEKGNKEDVMGGNEKQSEKEERESDSESKSESSSSSSSSSSSCSSDYEDEDGDEDDEEEESGAVSAKKKTKKKERMVEGEVDMEEGEIMLSDEEEMVAWGDDEDDVDAMTGPIKSKNEIKDLPPVPPVTATLQPHHQTLPVGTILSIMGVQVVVEGVEKHNPLSEGSILWITQSRSPLGIVDEIFGPVKNPYYVVRFNTESDIPTGIEQGTLISFVHEFATHVLNDKSLYQKGYDASNENEEELSEELEFSDDEKEAEYKRMLKMKKRGTNDSKPGKKGNDKRQFKNQNTNWNDNKAPETRTPSRIENRPIPPVSTSLNQENYPGPSVPAQGSGVNHPMIPPFPFNAPGPNFGGPDGIWGQSMGFPGAMPPNAIMPWMQHNNHNQAFQTPLPTGMMMPQQQQINGFPGFPGNFNPSSGLPNFGGAQGFAPWPGCLDPNVLGQLQFGMGLQAQPAPMPVNGGEQMGRSHGPQNGQNESEPSHVSSGGFNRGRGGGGGGRRGYYRGRGRGGGGRGRN